MNDQITMNGEYQTRGGDDVRVLATDLIGVRPVGYQNLRTGLIHKTTRAGKWVADWAESVDDLVPAEPRQMVVPWEVLDDRFICAAMNSSNVAFACERAPRLHKTSVGSVWAEQGSCVWNIQHMKAFKPPRGIDWKDSLVWRPGHEPEDDLE